MKLMRLRNDTTDEHKHNSESCFEARAVKGTLFSRAGFTMAELLVVVAIIAVLVAVAIPVFTAQLDKAKEATTLANARPAYAVASVTKIASPECVDSLVKMGLTTPGQAGIDAWYQGCSAYVCLKSSSPEPTNPYIKELFDGIGIKTEGEGTGYEAIIILKDDGGVYKMAYHDYSTDKIAEYSPDSCGSHPGGPGWTVWTAKEYESRITTASYKTWISHLLGTKSPCWNGHTSS